MILRTFDGGMDLIRQHDHGWVSGEFAEHWKERPSPSVRFAIRYHDVGWEQLDRTTTWNPVSGRPFTFVDHPMGEKIEAYKQGVDWVEARDPYAACLCSLHYTSFFEQATDETARRFLEEERRRQKRLEQRMDEETRSRLPADLALLKLCDDLSLFLCLNRPGENRHPWYLNGFSYRGERFQPEWKKKDMLSLTPNPFACSFTVRIPYERLTEAGHEGTSGTDVVMIQAE